MKKNLNSNEKVNVIKFNFLLKKREEEMYRKVVKMLLKKGYKPLNNTTNKFTFDCKETKTSVFSPRYAQYPYSITIKYYTTTPSINEYKQAA